MSRQSIKNKVEILRAEADRLEKLLDSKIPKLWVPGMRIRYFSAKDWCWGAGETGVIIAMHPKYEHEQDPEKQVFFSRPDNHVNSRFWTRADNVEWLPCKDFPE